MYVCRLGGRYIRQKFYSRPWFLDRIWLTVAICKVYATADQVAYTHCNSRWTSFKDPCTFPISLPAKDLRYVWTLSDPSTKAHWLKHRRKNSFRCWIDCLYSVFVSLFVNKSSGLALPSDSILMYNSGWVVSKTVLFWKGNDTSGKFGSREFETVRQNGHKISPLKIFNAVCSVASEL